MSISCLSTILLGWDGETYLAANNSGGIQVPNTVTNVPLKVTLSQGHESICASADPSMFPTQFSLTFGAPYNETTLCDPLSYETISKLGARATYINCQLPAAGANTNFYWTDTDAHNNSVKAPGSASLYTSDDPSDVIDLCSDSAYIDTTLFNNTQIFDTDDTSSLILPVRYNEWYCQLVGDSIDIFLALVDPKQDKGSFVDLYPNDPPGTFDWRTNTLRNVSFKDFGLPANGQLMDGTWSVSLYVTSDSASLIPDTQNIVISHNAAPTPSSGGSTMRKRLVTKWERYAAQGGHQRDIDSSFYVNGQSSCTLTQCPVWGQPGVFECIDTLTDLEACGGCPGHGEVCSDIPGAVSVECVAGKCVVRECEDGWRVATGGDRCV